MAALGNRIDVFWGFGRLAARGLESIQKPKKAFFILS
jgi:hypothetical protein